MTIVARGRLNRSGWRILIVDSIGQLTGQRDVEGDADPPAISAAGGDFVIEPGREEDHAARSRLNPIPIASLR